MKKLYALMSVVALTIGLAGCDLSWLFPTTTLTDPLSTTTVLSTGEITTTDVVLTTTESLTTTDGLTTTAGLTTTTTATTTTSAITTTHPTTTTTATTTTSAITTTHPTTTTNPTTTTTTATTVLFTVVFYNYDGVTVLKTVQVEAGGDAYPPLDPWRPANAEYRYQFTGWSASYENVQGDLSLVALYDSFTNVYTLTYVTNGGAPLNPEDIAYGATIAFRTTAKEYCSFLGWFVDLELSTPFSGTTMPAADLTLYAKWTDVALPLFNYDVVGGGAIVIGYNGTDTALVVPAEIDGYPVVGIAYGAFAGAALTSLTLPDSVQTIALGAFRGLADLTELTVPFIGGSRLGTDNQALLGSMFGDTEYPGSTPVVQEWSWLDYQTFYLPPGLVKVTITDDDTLGYGAFMRVKSLTDIILPAGFTAFGAYAFLGCEGLRSFMVPTLVTALPDSLFSQCVGLQSITLHEGITAIGIETFYGCTGLENLMLPTSVATIGQAAFAECRNLLSIALPDGLSAIAPHLFSGCLKLASVVVGPSIASIGEFAFVHCASLTEIIIPETVLTIGQYAFNLDDGLTIYAEAPSQPDAWDPLWNNLGLPVVWNHGFSYITFETNGGSAVAAIRASEGAAVTPPADPVKTDAVFIGWYSDDVLMTPYVFTTMPVSDLVLHAKWIQNDHTLTFVAYGGSAIDAVTAPGGSVVSIQNPLREGFTFDGWYEDGSLLTFYAATIVTMPFADMTLYAKWTINHYGIDLDAMGGTPDNYIYAPYGFVIDPALYVVTRTGYAFSGWYEDSAYTIFYAMEITTIVARDLSLFAKWTVNEYTLTFVENGGTDVPDVTAAYGSPIDMDNPTRTGFVFTGWYSDAERNVWYASEIDVMPAMDLTLFADWTVGRYDLAFDTTGGTAIDAIRDYYGALLTNPVTTRTGYEFCGWYEDAALTLWYGADVGVMPPRDLTLYAAWGTAGLAYTDIGGMLSVSNGTTYANAEIVIPERHAGMLVTKIADYNFAHRDALTSISLPASITTIGTSALSDCPNLTAIRIPAGLVTIGERALSENGFVTITVQNGSVAFTVVDGVLFSADLSVLVLYPTGTAATAYAVPGTVTSVAGYAFLGAAQLSSLTLAPSVTAIGALAFANCTSLLSFVVPASVKTIGDGAFINCTAMTSLVLSEGVESIGTGACNYCTALTSLTIPTSVTAIGQYAFAHCSALTSVDVLAGISGLPYMMFAGDTVLATVVLPADLSAIGAYAFQDCRGLVSIDLPASLTSIGEWAFGGCWNLAAITIPEGVTAISAGTFDFCRKLASVTIPGTVTSIGMYAFRYCELLTAITLPAGLTSFGWSAFADCSALTAIVIPAGVTALPDNLFWGCRDLASVTLPAGLKSIGQDAFASCSSLSNLVLPAGLTSIGRSAFSSCSGVTAIIVPESVTTIGSYAFGWCSALTIYAAAPSAPAGWENNWNYSSRPVLWGVNDQSISFDSNGGSAVSAISQNYGTAVFAPAEPAKTGSTFAGWFADEALTVAYVFTTMPAVGLTVYAKWSPNHYTITFEENGGSTVTDMTQDYGSAVTAPTAPTKAGYEFAGWYADAELTQFYTFSTMPVDGLTLYADWGTAGLSYTDIGGAYTVSGGTTDAIPDIVIPRRHDGLPITAISALAFKDHASLSSIMVGYLVISIGSEAFRGCTNLVDITLPDSLSSIDSWAFYMCYGLTTFMLPAGVTSIGIGVFYKNTHLTEIVADADNAAFSSEDGVLYNKTKTRIVSYPAGKPGTSFTIPAGITIINAYTFNECPYLTSITIPDGVTKIEWAAFVGCTNLPSIVIPGSVLTIEDYTFEACWAMTIYAAAASKPSGWTALWNLRGRPVYWGVNDQSISFESNGGSAVSAISQDFGTAVFAPAEPAKTGSTFAGWFADEALTVAYVFTTMPAVGLTVYAKWTPNHFTITFEENGGSTVTDITQDYGSAVTAPTAPTKAGYEFAGWYADAELTQFYTFSTMPVDGLTLYAAWTANQYVISFDANGGSAVEPVAVTFGTAVTSLFSPTRADFVFAGWTFDDQPVTLPYLYQIAGDATFVAAWSGLPAGVTYTVAAGNVTITGYNGTASILILPATVSGMPITAIAANAFKDKTALVSVTLGHAVVSIGNSAFSGCIGLVSINLPAGLLSIGNSAFSGCAALTSVVIPAGVGSLADYTFLNCGSLASVTLPAAMTSIGYQTFRGCGALWEITLPSGLTGMGSYAFFNSGLRSITIPGTLSTIPDHAFYNCTAMTSITLGEGVVAIGDAAFSQTYPVAFLSLPATLKTIGGWAFYMLSSLTNIVLPDGVTTIGPSAFAYCYNLAFTALPSSLTSIGDTAFRQCYQLVDLVIPGTVLSIGHHAFYQCSGLRTVTLQPGVMTIGDYAFIHCGALVSVIIPTTVTTIGYRPFLNVSGSCVLRCAATSKPAGWNAEWAYNTTTLTIVWNDPGA